MSGKATLWWGIGLIALGLIGLGALWALQPGGTQLPGGGTLASAGQRVYYTGLDADGQVIPRTVDRGAMMGPGMMGSIACVDCHGEDGRGGNVGTMFGIVGIPDIRYSVLTTEHSEGGKTIPAWSDADIRRAIREGIEPDGEHLKPAMPRWDMTDGQVTDVIAYLKELDER